MHTKPQVSWSRRPSQTALALFFSVCGFGAQISEAAEIPVGPLLATLEEVTTGLAADGQLTPTDMAPLADGSGRRLICTLGGVVRLADSSNALLDSAAAPYLTAPTLTSSQLGSTSIAVHPGFAANGKLYQVIAEAPGAPVDFGAPGALTSVLVEWTADSPASDSPAFTRRDILRVGQPQTSHNLMDLAFGLDGFLYIASGDGGGAQPARLRSQDLTNLYGKILRIDPLQTTGAGLTASANGQYGIPDDNYGATAAGALAEIYAFGFRNPYRLTFDRESGRGYIGEVGSTLWEEVNILANGANYGWGRFENGEIRDGAVALAAGSVHTEPALAYSHATDGETVVGGVVYRGSLIPELRGKYIFADFGRLFADGQPGVPTLPARLFHGDVDPDTGAIANIAEFQIAGEPLTAMDGGQAISNQFIFSINEDDEGEVYLLVGEDPLGGAVNPDGRVLKITSVNRPQLGVFFSGLWFLDRDGDGLYDAGPELLSWGSAASLPVPADWNGDGSTETGVYSDGVWVLDGNGDGAIGPDTKVVAWGLPGWTPVPGDWSGDSRANLGVVAPDSTWYRDINGDYVFNPATESHAWGSPGDIPAPADWNGDGRTEMAVYSNGIWYIDFNGNGVFDAGAESRAWGDAASTPVPGDWNGDGAAEIAVFNGGLWYIDFNGDGVFDPGTEVKAWGSPGDLPVAADWDGDGALEIGVYSGGLWFLDKNGDGVFDPETEAGAWGLPGWTPIPAKW